MVGILSGMDNEDRPAVARGDVSAVQDEPTPEENQPVAENTDNVEEVENVKELKSILKQRGQYTFRKVKVDFDLIPKKIPYDEDVYTVEIQIVEKEPVKIKSWAAIFAAKKAEAEAEAAAIAEAEEALKKAEEVQKREALKKANKAKIAKKSEIHPDANPQPRSSDLSCEQIERDGTHESEHIAEASDSSTTESAPREQTEPHVLIQSPSNLEEPKGKEAPPSCKEMAFNLNEPSKPELYRIGEDIVKELVEEAISTELFSQDQGNTDDSISNDKNKDSSRSESLADERSEHKMDINDDLEEIHTHEDASMSQFSDDPNMEEPSIGDESDSQLTQTTSNSEEQSSGPTSVTHSEGSQLNTRDSDTDSSSGFIKVQRKKVPKKVLVSAASLVEEILSEMPEVLLAGSNANEISKSIDNEAEVSAGTLINNDVENEFLKPSNEAKTKQTNDILESRAQRKRREFKKPNDSRIYEHVKRSLERAAPEILETAVGVLEEIEKVVIDKVGSAIS